MHPDIPTVKSHKPFFPSETYPSTEFSNERYIFQCDTEFPEASILSMVLLLKYMTVNKKQKLSYLD